MENNQQENTSRIPSGVGGLDELFGGGFPRQSMIVVLGSPHSGKSTLVWHYLAAQPDVTSLYISLEHPIDTVLKRCRKIGLSQFIEKYKTLNTMIIEVIVSTDDDPHLANTYAYDWDEYGHDRIVGDDLRVFYTEFKNFSIDLFSSRFHQILDSFKQFLELRGEDQGSTHIGIDSLTPLLICFRSPEKIFDFFQKMTTTLSQIGTTMITVDKFDIDSFNSFMKVEPDKVKALLHYADIILELFTEEWSKYGGGRHSLTLNRLGPEVLPVQIYDQPKNPNVPSGILYDHRSDIAYYPLRLTSNGLLLWDKSPSCPSFRRYGVCYPSDQRFHASLYVTKGDRFSRWGDWTEAL